VKLLVIHFLHALLFQSLKSIDIFVKKIGPGMHKVTQNLVGEEVSYTDAKRNRFWNTVPVCVLLRKNVRNGVPTPSVTKLPLLKSECYSRYSVLRHSMFIPQQNYSYVFRTIILRFVALNYNYINKTCIINPFNTYLKVRSSILCHVNLIPLDRRLVWLWWGMLMPVGMPC
jgi:hypothetical protein